MGILGGLLQPLQQCVGGAVGHALRRCQYHHFARTEPRGAIDKGNRLAHLLDAYDLAGALGLQPAKVAVTTGLAVATGPTLTAVVTRDWLVTKQIARQCQCQALLANAGGAGKQQRMGQLLTADLLL